MRFHCVIPGRGAHQYNSSQRLVGGMEKLCVLPCVSANSEAVPLPVSATLLPCTELRVFQRCISLFHLEENVAYASTASWQEDLKEDKRRKPPSL